MLRPTPGDPRGVEQHHWNTGAEENQQLNSLVEPTHGVMALFVLHKLIFQIRINQGSTGGFRLLQRFSVGLAADHFYLVSEFILSLYVFFDGALMSKKSCTQIG